MARLIECIPNFSCSKEKDEATYNELVKTVSMVPHFALQQVSVILAPTSTYPS